MGRSRSIAIPEERVEVGGPITHADNLVWVAGPRTRKRAVCVPKSADQVPAVYRWAPSGGPEQVVREKKQHSRGGNSEQDLDLCLPARADDSRQ